MTGASASQESGNTLLEAAQWIEGLVQGPLAVTLAILAVAGTGLMMLNGRLPARRGAIVIVGCFLLFGAPAIARGLYASASSVAGSDRSPSSSAQVLPEPPVPEPPPTAPSEADPYAGASVIR